jgi:hypothetical protein
MTNKTYCGAAESTLLFNALHAGAPEHVCGAARLHAVSSVMLIVSFIRTDVL